MESSASHTSPKEKAPKNDTFAHIAQKIGSGIGGLQENLPEALPDVELPYGPFQPSHDFASLRRSCTAKEMREELALLRQAFAPFLATLEPPLPSTRLLIPVKQAQWRPASENEKRTPMEGCGEWTQVQLPHYGGPIGRAATFYRSEIELPKEALRAERLYLCFRAADYRAKVYLNGYFLMEHEGFFEPFEIDVTDVARPGKNILLVRLENDLIGNGNEAWGQKGNGEKIYAATGLGWDEPGLGWHHCPPGMGIYQEVYFETRPSVHFDQVWARALPQEQQAELHVILRNTGPAPVKIAFTFNLFGSNFEATLQEGAGEWQTVEPGRNHFQVTVKMPGFRWWTPQQPWLYNAQLRLRDENGGTVDAATTTFGMRIFEVSEEGPEKGRIFLNGKEIRLRGANTMGHEQQCVFYGNLEQLRDDILIAKHAGLNFLRLTQRPVQKEIYDACDQLGMMVQTDLPFFGKVPRSQFAEGVRQAGAMERLIREHACCVLVSLINEPFPIAWGDTTHRHLNRSELEAFLRACSEIIRYENPDRQIKPADGDYDPPSDGLPDNHCYCGWYAGHALDLGKLHRGHWVPTKPGWRYACGEFGSEGLDPADLMRRRYPKSWLPEGGDESLWSPSRISHSQTGSMYGLWMDASQTMEEWVKTSQDHQAWITHLMTRAFRRDRRMVSFAIHLLIDAFPAGWMKTLVDCERNPKPAYFAYRDALQPLLVDIRTDRWAWWSEENFSAEIWICHDLRPSLPDCQLRYVLEVDGRPHASGSSPAAIPECSSFCQGTLRIPLPKVCKRTKGQLRAAIVTSTGTVLSETAEALTLFPKMEKRPSPPSLFLWDVEDKIPGRFFEELSIPKCVTAKPQPGEVIVSSRAEVFPQIHAEIERGATLLLLELAPGEFDIARRKVTVETAGFGPRHFVSRATGHPVVREFEKNDFRFWHDPAEDCATALLDTLFFAEGWTSILSTVQAGWGITGYRNAFACAECRVGLGKVIICQVKLVGRTATNPPAMIFARHLLEMSLT